MYHFCFILLFQIINKKVHKNIYTSLKPVRVVTAPEQRGSAPSHLMQALALLLTATPPTKVILIL